MIMKVVGTRTVSFKPKGEEKVISGLSLFCVYQDEHVTGYATDRIFCSPDKFVNGITPNVEDTVDILYNKYGKVASIEVRK